MRRRSQTLPAMPTSKDATTGGSSSNVDPVDDQPNKSTGEKFKDMLQQLDRMILDKQEEMNEAKEL